jgi:hypothetical protein
MRFSWLSISATIFSAIMGYPIKSFVAFQSVLVRPQTGVRTYIPVSPLPSNITSHNAITRNIWLLCRIFALVLLASYVALGFLKRYRVEFETVLSNAMHEYLFHT